MKSNTIYLKNMAKKIETSDNYLYNKSLPENKNQFEKIETANVNDFEDSPNMFQKLFG